MKIKRILSFLLKEFFNTVLGFTVGVISSNLMLTLFEVKGYSNLWGYWSTKTVLSEDFFNVLQWLISITVGYIIMKLVNLLINHSAVKSFISE